MSHRYLGVVCLVIAFGSLMPLRIPEAPIAKLDLSGFDEARRAAIEYGNLTAWQSRER